MRQVLEIFYYELVGESNITIKWIHNVVLLVYVAFYNESHFCGNERQPTLNGNVAC